MRITVYLVVALIGTLAPVGFCQTSIDTAGPHLTAQGHAEIKTTADVAFVTLTVKTTARREAAAAQENAIRTTALLAQIRTIASIKTEDIETSDYSVGREFKNEDTAPIFIGYQVTNTVKVTLHNVSRASRLIDLAVASGAARITDLTYSLADRQAAERRALTQAVADARGRAQTMAFALGMTLGSLRAVSDSSAAFEENVISGAGVYSPAGFGRTTPISPQVITIRADASVDYNLTP